MDGVPHTVHVGLLFILVDMVYPVLSKSVELPCVVEYTMVPLLQAQELLQLAVEQTHRLVMCTKGSMEFTPWNMVIIR
jgi:hypothetical protein